MKKILALTLCVVLMTLMCACNSDNTSSTGSGTASDIYSSAITDSDSLTAYNGAVSFLEALKTNNQTALDGLVYDVSYKNTVNTFSSNVSIKEYSVSTREESYTDFTLDNMSCPSHYFKVYVNIADSKEPQIDCGASQWVIGLDDAAHVMIFTPECDFMNINNYDSFTRQSNMCILYDTLTDEYNNSPHSDEVYTTALELFCLAADVKNNSELSADKINYFIQNECNIKDFNIMKSSYYDSDDKIKNFSSDKILPEPMLIKNASKLQSGDYKLIINYYTDSMYMLKRKTVNYTISAEKDGSYSFGDITTPYSMIHLA